MNCNGCNKKRAIWFCLWAAAFSAAAAWGNHFTAADSSSEEVYKDAETWVGLNGGSGFSKWEVRSGEAVDDYSDEQYNEGDFTLASGDGGEAAVGRDLTQALSSGTFEVEVWHGTTTDDFRGMAVYGTERDELLRWGIQDDGFYYSLDGGGKYTLFPDGRYKPADSTVPVVYSLTWSSVDTGLQFELAGQFSGWEMEWSPFTVGLKEGARAVGGIGVLVSGSEKDVEGKEMAGMGFDNLRVTGKAVPEPGTAGLLLAGAAVVAGLKRRRAGRG